MTYDEFVQAMYVELQLTEDHEAFDVVLPQLIEYVENRLQRDLSLVGTSVTKQATLGINTRNFNLPTLQNDVTFISVSTVNPVIGGVRKPPLEKVTRGFIDSAFPSDTAPDASAEPMFWCQSDQTAIMVAPSVEVAIRLEIVGEGRVARLSDTKPTNILGNYFGDMYVALGLVWGFGHERDYGAQSDDPQAAVSWEAQYQRLKAGADTEEARKRWDAVFSAPMIPGNYQAKSEASDAE